jgi:hypothetical protein
MEFSLFVIAFIPGLGPAVGIKAPISGDEGGGWDVRLTTYPYLVPMLRMSGAIPPAPTLLYGMVPD